MREARAEKDDSHDERRNQRQSRHGRGPGRARRAGEGRPEERAPPVLSLALKRGQPSIVLIPALVILAIIVEDLPCGFFETER